MSNQDRNAAAVVSALRAAGATVWYIESAAGVAGLPDLLVSFNGRTYLMEVKTRLGRLSSAQKAFFSTWTGGPAMVVRSPEEALAAIGLAVQVAS